LDIEIHSVSGLAAAGVQCASEQPGAAGHGRQVPIRPAAQQGLRGDQRAGLRTDQGALPGEPGAELRADGPALDAAAGGAGEQSVPVLRQRGAAAAHDRARVH
jgi:hypothetical protein